MPVNRMSNTAAQPAPSTMPQNRSRGGSARTASAITTALSPDSRILIPMICRAANQKVGRIISLISTSTRPFPSEFPYPPQNGDNDARVTAQSAYKALEEDG